MKRPLAPRGRRRGAVVAGIGLALTVSSAIPVAAEPFGAAQRSGSPHGRFLSPVTGTDATSAPSADRVLTRVAHGDHVLTFVEHTAISTIGVYETSKAGATPYLAGVRGGEIDPHTALEVYLAVSTAAPPAELLADHAQQQAGPPESIELPPLHGDPEPADGSCVQNGPSSTSTNWADVWHSGIGQQHDLHAELTFFEDINGSDGKYYNANRSSARWLAACNGGTDYGGAVAGKKQIFLTPLSLANGTWAKHYEERIAVGEQVIYWSPGGPERWNLRMREDQPPDNTVNIRNWAIGGAIDKPFGIVGNGD
jgi:hypothetical protein